MCFLISYIEKLLIIIFYFIQYSVYNTLQPKVEKLAKMQNKTALFLWSFSPLGVLTKVNFLGIIVAVLFSGHMHFYYPGMLTRPQSTRPRPRPEHSRPRPQAYLQGQAKAKSKSPRPRSRPRPMYCYYYCILVITQQF